MPDDNLTERYHPIADRFGRTFRQVAFAGLALVWLFKADLNGKTAFPLPLVHGAWSIASGLAGDLVEQFLLVINWWVGRIDGHGWVVVGRTIRGAALFCLFAKFFLLISGYANIIGYVGTHWYFLKP